MELLSGVSAGVAVMNIFAVYLIYRQYRSLAEVSLEYAGLVVSSIREQEGEIVVDPLALAGISMDHLSQVSGMVNWIRG
jgi:hypothetical protein